MTALTSDCLFWAMPVWASMLNNVPTLLNCDIHAGVSHGVVAELVQFHCCFGLHVVVFSLIRKFSGVIF